MNFHFCPRRHECISWQRSGGSRKEDLPLLSCWPPLALALAPSSLPNSSPLFSYLVTPPQNNCSSLPPLVPSSPQHEMSVGAALVLTRGQGGPPCQSVPRPLACSAPAPATPAVNGRSDDSGGGGGAMGGLGGRGGGGRGGGPVVRGHSASKKQFPRRRLRPLALPARCERLRPRPCDQKMLCGVILRHNS